MVAGTVMIAGAPVDTGGEVTVTAVATALEVADAGSDVDEFSIAEPTSGPDEPCDASHPAMLINGTAIKATSSLGCDRAAVLDGVQPLPDLTNFS